MSAKIIGIDIPWFDELIKLPSLPKNNRSCRIDSLGYAGGGKVSTALVAAARLQIDVKLLAVLGKGAKGNFLLEDFLFNNVDCSSIRLEENYQDGFSLILSDDATNGRRIFYKYDDEALGLKIDEIDNALQSIKEATFLHLCRMNSIDCHAAKMAKNFGTTICLDADFFSPEIIENINLIDIFIGSEEFFSTYLNKLTFDCEDLVQLTKLGPSTVIVTLGSKGCFGLANGEFFSIPAFKNNIKIVDTVGAGDVFHGAYLAGLCHGFTPKKAAIYASATSAIKCTAQGGRAAIPTHDMVMDYLENGIYDKTMLQKRIEYYQMLGKNLF